MPRKAKQLVEPIDTTMDTLTAAVFSGQRTVHAPPLALPDALKPNTRLKMDGLDFLAMLPACAIPVAFLDPQYRGVLEKLSYGNEGKDRGKRRCALEQMTDAVIGRFVRGINRALIPVGPPVPVGRQVPPVPRRAPVVRRNQPRYRRSSNVGQRHIRHGYRTRRRAEYCVVLQKQPRKAKGVWKIHNITDVIQEQASQREHPHTKPVDLQGELMAAVSHEGDFVIDPAAGSFSVLQAARNRRRTFLGCDLNG